MEPAKLNVPQPCKVREDPCRIRSLGEWRMIRVYRHGGHILRSLSLANEKHRVEQRGIRSRSFASSRKYHLCVGGGPCKPCSNLED